MGAQCVIRAVNVRREMSFRLPSLLVMFACASYLPAVHGAERVGDATYLYELERYANAVTALDTEILSSIEAAPSEERFYLYWTCNHLTGSWAQVEYLQTQLELSFEAQSYPDEVSIRTTVRDQAEFVGWELGHAIDELAQTTPEIRPMDYPLINDAVRLLLSEIRTTVDRLWTDQCAYMPCVVGP